MNARFWVYVNGGPVKLTLKPGQSLTHETGGPCDEGWSHEITEWTHETIDYADSETPVVTRNWSTESQDCDGRHGSSGTDSCWLGELRRGSEPYYTALESWEDPTTWDGVIWPDWTEVRHNGVYDQFAQMAGY